MGFLDLLFPKQCVGCSKLGSYLCLSCVQKIDYLTIQICSYCYKPAIAGQTHPRCARQFGLDGIVSFTSYQNPIKELIKALKYRSITDLLKEVSTKITFPDELIVEKTATVVPLPLFKGRQNQRGFNQTDLLGKLVATKLNLLYDKTILERVVATKSQVGLSQGQRVENIANAFKVKQTLNQEKYYIFDDVWTSGASLKEAAKTLKKAGAKTVWGLTLAHPR